MSAEGNGDQDGDGFDGGEWLGGVSRLRTTVRADRRASSTPILVLAVVAVIGAGLGDPSVVYWLPAITVAMVGLWLWQRRRLDRLGLGGGPVYGKAALGVGVGLWLLPGWMLFDVAGPWWAIGAVLIALGWSGHDRWLMWTGVGAAVLGTADCLYAFSNVVPVVGVIPALEGHAVYVLPAAALVLVAGLAWERGR